MTVEIIRSNGHITIYCDEGDDFTAAYLQVIEEDVITCSSCGSQNVEWSFYPSDKTASYKCNSCGKTWKYRKEGVFNDS